MQHQPKAFSAATPIPAPRTKTGRPLNIATSLKPSRAPVTLPEMPSSLTPSFERMDALADQLERQKRETLRVQTDLAASRDEAARLRKEIARLKS